MDKEDQVLEPTHYTVWKMQPITFISAFALDEDGQEGLDKWARER